MWPSPSSKPSSSGPLPRHSNSSPSSPSASPAGRRKRLPTYPQHADPRQRPNSNISSPLHSPRHAASKSPLAKPNAKDILQSLLADLITPFRRKSSQTNQQDSGLGGVLFHRNGEEDYVMIELDHFGSNGIPLARSYHRQHSRKLGHDFLPMALLNPAWCDKCSDIMWGLDQDTCLRCQNCHYTCHHRCQDLITLECQPPSQTPSDSHHRYLIPTKHSLTSSLSSTSTSSSSVSKSSSSTSSSSSKETSLSRGEDKVPVGDDGVDAGALPEFDGTFIVVKQTGEAAAGLPPAWSVEELHRKIEEYNGRSLGLQMSLMHDGVTFRGFVRVHLDLHRPINICAGSRPPSIFDVIQSSPTSPDSEGPGDTVKQSFYIPKGTVKALHITSETRAGEVIKALLKKFKVADNPRKFALYEKVLSSQNKYKFSLRRILDHERPLYTCLAWGQADIQQEKLVLQENETGEVMWDAFSLPELHNFLRILDREEEEYEREVRRRYRLFKEKLMEAAELVRRQAEHCAETVPSERVEGHETEEVGRDLLFTRGSRLENDITSTRNESDC